MPSKIHRHMTVHLGHAWFSATAASVKSRFAVLGPQRAGGISAQRRRCFKVIDPRSSKTPTLAERAGPHPKQRQGTANRSYCSPFDRSLTSKILKQGYFGVTPSAKALRR